MAVNKIQIMGIVINNAKWRLAYYDLLIEPFIIVDLEKFQEGNWVLKATCSMDYQTNTPRDTRWNIFMNDIKAKFEAVLNAFGAPASERDVIIAMLKKLKIELVDGAYAITYAA